MRRRPRRPALILSAFEDLAETVKKGELNFDVVIATPDAMRVVGQLGQILGPRGLMPNPKVGTVTADVEGAVKNAKAGQVRYRTDKAGHYPLPDRSCGLRGDGADRKSERAAGGPQEGQAGIVAKGAYVKKLTISSTMGPGVSVDRAVRRRLSQPANNLSDRALRAGWRMRRRDAAIVEDHRRPDWFRS